MFLLKEEVKEFASLAREYCDLIENHKSYLLVDFLRSCRKLILRLYFLGTILPEIEDVEDVESERYGHENWEKLCKSLEIYLGDLDIYYEVVNPCEKDDACPITISVDLSEIVESIKPSLILFEKGTEKDVKAAIFEWKLCFWHWGDHMLSVLRPLHELLTQRF
jgi:hypothetical protein